MGAALHLAHAHHEPVKKRRPKRTGGGDGPKFAEIANQIFRDNRADTESRQLLLAVAYAVTMAELNDDTSVWAAARAALGTPRNRHRYHFQELVRRDLPRYEAPGYRWGDDPMQGLCAGPRVRPHPDGAEDFRNRLNVCGAPASEYAVEKQLDTGWHKNHWFCPRHRDHLTRVCTQVAAQNAAAPPPIPNRGGLLPCYFESDWLRVYRWATGHEGWEPPVYGLRADDWPVPGQDPLPQRARLRLVLGGHSLESGEEAGDDDA
ncbi:hypothetical protein ACF06X_33750 [Streptomyces sp. NPDC015346]|uniref:hypothetical protein n=1 Tax=Streptomyces sp. NPDC015346 TaxID=3364954 RepID=UPI0036F7B034